MTAPRRPGARFGGKRKTEPPRPKRPEPTEPIGIKPGTLRVWWVPQVPGPRFITPVADLAQAKLLLATLTRYDLFQVKNSIKPDYANVGGLQEFDGSEWCEWHEDWSGDDIVEVMIRDVA